MMRANRRPRIWASAEITCSLGGRTVDLGQVDEHAGRSDPRCFRNQPRGTHAPGCRGRPATSTGTPITIYGSKLPFINRARSPQARRMVNITTHSLIGSPLDRAASRDGSRNGLARRRSSP